MPTARLYEKNIKAAKQQLSSQEKRVNYWPGTKFS